VSGVQQVSKPLRSRVSSAGLQHWLITMTAAEVPTMFTPLGAPDRRVVLLQVVWMIVHHTKVRLLVLGGTRFVGHAIVRAAFDLGWQVATFNRGLSGADLPGVVALRGHRTLADDLARIADAGPWDAVIDTSGYVPRDTLAVAEILEPAARRYVFMSTVSVYRGWPTEPLSEDSETLYCPAVGILMFARATTRRTAERIDAGAGSPSS